MAYGLGSRPEMTVSERLRMTHICKPFSYTHCRQSLAGVCKNAALPVYPVRAGKILVVLISLSWGVCPKVQESPGSG